MKYIWEILGKIRGEMDQRKGFTLIELLVVIAVIGVLMSILLPAMSMVRRKARKVLCMSNHKQIALGLTMYANSNDEKFPIHPGQGGNGAPYFYVMNKNNLADDILSYVSDDAKIFLCPAAPKGAQPPDRTIKAPSTMRWNFYYMANYENAELGYKSPVKGSTSSGKNALWSEHVADVGPSWGNIRASHVRRPDGQWPLEPADYGDSYLQWSVLDEKKIEDVSCVFVDGSCRRLQLEDMYYMTSTFGGNWYPPAEGYTPSDSDLRGAGGP